VKKLTQKEILQASTKLLDFVDLCGHERYLKTTIRGLTGNAPDYCMLMLGANMGVQRMTKEHLGVSLSLKLPTFVIITKIDISPEHVTEKTTKRICRILKSPAAGKKMPILIRNIDDVMTVVQNCASGRVVPIFRISCVSGKNLDLLKLFLNLLPNNKEWKRLHSLPAEFSIDGSYQVTGVGTVVSGTLFQGRIHLGDELLLGPSPKWRRVTVKGIHTNRVPIQHAEAGMSASFHVKNMDSREKLKKNHVRKGMVLVTPSPPPQTVRFFEAEVVILHHPTTIKERYEPVIHCRTVRQSAIVVSMSKSLLRTGQSAKVLFKFSHHPEFITVGSQILFREGRTKGLGEICAVFANEDEASASQLWK
jgi:GTPase